jgi:putative endonuclease
MHEVKAPAVYIMASRYRGTLYVGVTSALWHRVNDHKNGRYDGFTAEYDVTLLVWYEHHHSMEDAIRREKQLKKWKREWKLRFSPCDCSWSLNISTIQSKAVGPVFFCAICNS